jgi:hypothetical protein
MADSTVGHVIIYWTYRTSLRAENHVNKLPKKKQEE